MNILNKISPPLLPQLIKACLLSFLLLLPAIVHEHAQSGILILEDIELSGNQQEESHGGQETELDMDDVVYFDRAIGFKVIDRNRSLKHGIPNLIRTILDIPTPPPEA